MKIEQYLYSALNKWYHERNMNNGNVQAMYDKCFNYLRTNAFFFFSFFICCQTYPCQVTAEPMVYYIFKDDNDIFILFLISSCNLVVGPNVKSNIFFCCWWAILDSIFCSWYKNKQTRIFAFKTVAIFSKAKSAIWNVLRAQIIYGPG